MVDGELVGDVSTIDGDGAVVGTDRVAAARGNVLYQRYGGWQVAAFGSQPTHRDRRAHQDEIAAVEHADGQHPIEAERGAGTGIIDDQGRRSGQCRQAKQTKPDHREGEDGAGPCTATLAPPMAVLGAFTHRTHRLWRGASMLAAAGPAWNSG